MNFAELMHQTLNSLRTHKLRSFLALFGIMWGTLSVVLLLALGNGFYNHNQHEMRRIANGQIFMRTGITTKPYQGRPTGQIIHIKVKDILAMANDLPQIKMITPLMNFATVGLTLTSDKHQVKGTVEGVSNDYPDITQVDIANGGHFFNQIDLQHNNKVVFLTDHMKQVLYPHSNPINKTLHISGIPFTVVGYQSPQRQGGAHWRGNLIYVPYTTYQQLWGDQDSAEVALITHTPQQVDNTKQAIRHYLASRFHFDPTDSQAIMMPDLTKIVHFFDWFFWGIKTFLIFCGALTLAVGGIGVANIMFLIVSERTAEIGLRLALGSPDSSILWQILLESLMLVFIGGVAGIVLAMTIVTTLQHLPLPDWIGTPKVSLIAMIISFVTLAIVGIAAGYFPAKKASLLEPVVALAG
ncbi:MAG: ABC transporter permease [Coxiellaceae bacterium]|nr:ABC transporter permease [Coxiellaceae bacterium]